MTGYRIRDLAAIPGCTPVGLDLVLRRAVSGISTDTRTLKRGQVFLAIRGDRFDGHAFVGEARARGALACVVDTRWWRRHRTEHADGSFAVVPDTVAAYGAIARAYRDRFDIPVLLLTGSNGKTSTKEMIAAVLGTKYRVLVTEGNLNNHVGLPAMLLRLTAAHDAAVLEAGTNRPGEIPHLCAVAGQTHAIVTNIGRAHIERLRTREGIAEEKGAAYRTLPGDGVAYLNVDEPLLAPHVRRGLTRITYGTGRRAAVRLVSATLDSRAQPDCTISAPDYQRAPVRVKLQARGLHSAMNAVAALAVGFSFGCPSRAMKHALEQLPAYDGRLVVERAGDITILDDTYNANPDSVLAALDVLDRMHVEGAKVVVLGDMLELGRSARSEHRAVGERMAALRIPYVLTYGVHSRETAGAAKHPASFAAHFTDLRLLESSLNALLSPGDAVLIKGSHGMHMEEVVAHLRTVRPRVKEA